MNKKTLGIIIPYYKNSEECEIAFRNLMGVLNNQLTDDMILFIWEDGQYSEWLQMFKKNNILVEGCSNINYGVSVARNKGINYLIDKVEYILFIDSDDRVADNYLKVMCEYCADKTHEVIESTFYVNRDKAQFNPNLVRSGVAGSAIQTKIIGDIRFDERLQIAEDTTFMNSIIDLSKHRKKHAPTNYYYQYGINPNSLIMRYNRKDIRKER